MKKTELAEKVRIELNKLSCLTEDYISEDFSMCTMEKGILKQLLLIGLSTLKYIIYCKIAKLKGFQPKSEEGERLESKGTKERKYLSIFGLLDFVRAMHWSKKEGSHYELDKRLELPAGLWSYNLQEWVGENASENDFQESVKLFNKILGLEISGMGAQRNADCLGKFVDSYYEKQIAEMQTIENQIVENQTIENQTIENKEVALCFSASFDGKGVPKITEKKKAIGNPKKRLEKGEKRGTKQEATVSVTSTFTPKKRTKASIIRSLMGSPLSKVEPDEEGKKLEKENDNRWHQEIHRRAFLANQAKAIEYGLDDIRARMTNRNSRFVVPIDAGVGLENKVLAYVEKHNMKEQFEGIIIDIIHVSEYVWDLCTAILGENSTFRAGWVRKMLEDLLDSKTEQVICDIEKIKVKGTLSESQRKQVVKTLTYFSNNKHNMDYKKFIEKGYPVSSALVESACGHLVKERMEKTGMRWSSNGAQNILNLRAVSLNGDMEDFMNFVVEQDHKKQTNKAA